jgi:hypothetical protein
MTIIEEETNQSDTNTIHPDIILKGKIPLENVQLPEPYLIMQDRLPSDKLSKVINILAIKKVYRVVSFSVNDYFGYVLKEEEKDKEEK